MKYQVVLLHEAGLIHRRRKLWNTGEEEDEMPAGWTVSVRMPTLMRNGPLRVFFYSNEGDPRGPPHVHVIAGGDEAKF
ncbi:DUF4160 domain-containing protein [Jannaschia rubra]|uniref:DUF4160 domain-containing protein n=1 Tax=Jannaschia rubra TaxID=282197 RepID=A0A0M6XSH9_9RHOB|nr:DUF4160 domain-containing protein [Jannaschia rubra]CTQ33135.1 hypothetical protein JAN5088_01915 [Jannaschia rubra]SFG83331.1 protein of unknown function [Jannaschia rubra]